MDQASRRLLAVHAHPDDESITTGATMAYYVSSGAHVTLLTCTLGEEGEVLVPELSLLAAEQADPLGDYGHPDHIMAHRVAMAAVERAAEPGLAATGEPWPVAKVYWTAVPRS